MPEDQPIQPAFKKDDFVSQAETNKTNDGETDPAILIKLGNQRRVYKQHGLPWPPEDPTIEPPAEQEPPGLVGLDPDTAVIGGEDVTMVATGSNFAEGTKIVFNGGEENTVIISSTECSTIVKPSLAGAAVSVPVTVRNEFGESSPIQFSFTEDET